MNKTTVEALGRTTSN